MPRTARVESQSQLYHVGTRGNNGRDIYVAEGDRHEFLALLGNVVRTEQWILYSYCLMGHHYHLLVAADLSDLSSGMHLLNGVYAKAFNRRHRRRGHLFEDRFWSEPVERDEHLLESSRYIPLNPVRAGYCRRPEQWRWSSYRALVGIEPAPHFLAVDATLALFGRSRIRAARRFRTFVEDH